MRSVSRVAFACLFISAIFPVLGRGEVATKKVRLTAAQTYCTGHTPCVLTAHNNNNRDGVNPNESILKASTLSASNHPTPRWLATTDGLLFAQPLYIHQLSIGGGQKNVVYAVTENNSVYAFDSASTSPSGTILTQANLNNASDLSAGSTEIAVPYTDLPQSCTLIVPEVGIFGNCSAYGSTNPGSPGSVKFVTPTIVDGKIFMGGGAQGYEPGSANCPPPSPAVQPTACGGPAMYG